MSVHAKYVQAIHGVVVVMLEGHSTELHIFSLNCAGPWDRQDGVATVCALVNN